MRCILTLSRQKVFLLDMKIFINWCWLLSAHWMIELKKTFNIKKAKTRLFSDTSKWFTLKSLHRFWEFTFIKTIINASASIFIELSLCLKSHFNLQLQCFSVLTLLFALSHLQFFAFESLHVMIYSTYFKSCHRHSAASLLRLHYSMKTKMWQLMSLIETSWMMQLT